MAEDLGERTEQPTAKRLSDARAKGQTGKSTDLSSAILMLGALVLTMLFAERIFNGWGQIMYYNLAPETFVHGVEPKTLFKDVAITAGEAARVAVPVMLLMSVAAYLSQYLQVGFMFSLKTIEPKLNKLNPISGAKKLLSRRSLVKGGIDLLKFAIIGAVSFIVIQAEFEQIIAICSLPLGQGIIVAAELLRILAIWGVVVLLLLGFIDWSYQKWQMKEDLKMTKHEVKDERKASEGDVETKGRRMKLARQIAMQRLQNDVPNADVVVTNPTHFAVALKYDAERMNAPKVIAKGADYLAMKIRYIAVANQVPILERPPLARALYANVEVGQEIKPEYYEAVAEILAYIYRLEGRAAS